MTQLSPYTVAYDQIAKAVASLVEKWSKGDYVTKQSAVEDFNKSLNSLYSSVGSTKTQLEQFIKGEPPSSKKMNSFLNGFKEDINVAAKQLDYLGSKVVNVFNLLNNEIESEKNYSKRIASKAKVLQMYAESPADDIVYVGDSFDNQDYIDIQKHVVGKIPLVSNGQLTLQISKKSDWTISSVRINGDKCNGFLGNNHAVVRTQGVVDNRPYRYVFEESSSLANKNNISDKNPLTYFEYEALSVEHPADATDYEFSYIVDDVSIVNSAKYKKDDLIKWSNHDTTKPLVLDFTLQTVSAQKVNSITIAPYFASSKLVKVSSVTLTLKDGTTKEVLGSPIYIGASPQNITTKSYGSHFIDRAVVQFEEVEAVSANVVVEQDQFQNIEIQHVYWETNYPTNTAVQDQSPFYGKIKFNPFTYNQDIYQEIRFNKETIIPKLTNPISIKSKNVDTITLPVTFIKKAINSAPSQSTTYAVPLKLAKQMLPAKRMSIGIRDISLEYNEFLNTAQFISKPFYFDLPVESLILNVDSNYASLSETSTAINCSVSVDDGKNWKRISPIQSGYQNGDEILAFNQNIPSGYKLPGVTYYGYPDVPKEIKSVIVKMEISKNQTVNKTPVLYSYTLGAKVKKS